MAKKKTIIEPPVEETKDRSIQWGGTKQELILEKTPPTKAQRHRCKGTKCIDAFQESKRFTR